MSIDHMYRCPKCSEMLGDCETIELKSECQSCGHRVMYWDTITFPVFEDIPNASTPLNPLSEQPMKKLADDFVPSLESVITKLTPPSP